MEQFVWVGKGGRERRLRLFEARTMGHRMVAHFHGISSREAAQELVNGELRTEAERLPDPGPGQAYTFQLLGLRMVDLQGRELGVVKACCARARIRSTWQGGARRSWCLGGADRETGRFRERRDHGGAAGRAGRAVKISILTIFLTSFRRRCRRAPIRAARRKAA